MQSFRSNRQAPPPPSARGPPPSAPPLISTSPHRSRLSTQLNVTPRPGAVRDWEGWTYEAVYGAPRPTPGVKSPPRMVRREGSPSTAVLRDATERANKTMPPAIHSPHQAGPHDFADHLVDHLTYVAQRRRDYEERLQAEARGEQFIARRPYSEGFANHVQTNEANGMVNINFTGRSQNVPAQMVATRDEIAWLHPPPIPQPLGWNGYWDLCAGHENILQLMAVTGANPDNSPSLTAHFMYPELLSCFQRLQYGAYMVLYERGEPPHERYFYVKSLPLANKAQYCPFLCWSTHRNAHNALDCIPLTNIMWITQGMETPNFQKYYVGGDTIKGPFVGKHKAECLTYGCFTIWIFDGNKLRALDCLACDPLVFTMWMKLLEDCAQLNAALDLTGSVRSTQRYIEERREEGQLAGIIYEKKKSFFAGLYTG